ncbi:MAG: transporter [Phenylobacterium sp.]|nr:transporter [Phenylobacterium sp.]
MATVDSSRPVATEGVAEPAGVIERMRYPSAAMGWITVAVLFVLYIQSLAARMIVALQVDSIKAGLHLSDLEIGMLQGPAFAVLYSIFAIPVGLALDRYSRRLVLFLSIFIWSLAATSCGLANGFLFLLIARALVGAGEAGFGTGAYSIIGDSFPPAKVSAAMSIFVMGGVMGAGIVFLLGGPLVRHVVEEGASVWPLLGMLAPWQKVFIYVGAPGLLLAFLVLAFQEPPRQAKPRTAGAGGYAEALRFIGQHPRTFASIFLGFGLVYSMTIAMQTWSPAFFARVHHWRPDQIGVRLGLAQILGALTLPLHGMIVDHLMRRGRQDAPLLWCMLTGLVALPLAVAAYWVRDGWLSIVLITLYFGFMLSSASMGPAAIQMVTPQHLRGRISALYVMATGLIAMGVGTSLVGLLTDKLFGDPTRVGDSLIVTVFLVMAPGIALYAWGRGGLRHSMPDVIGNSAR